MSTYDIKATATKPAATRFDFWLIFDKHGPMKLTRSKPGTKRDERAMFLQVTLPNSLWATPELRATVTVGETGQPLSIDVEAASEALKAVLGVDVDVKISAAPTPEAAP